MNQTVGDSDVMYRRRLLVAEEDVGDPQLVDQPCVQLQHVGGGERLEHQSLVPPLSPQVECHREILEEQREGR